MMPIVGDVAISLAKIAQNEQLIVDRSQKRARCVNGYVFKQPDHLSFPSMTRKTRE